MGQTIVYYRSSITYSTSDSVVYICTSIPQYTISITIVLLSLVLDLV